MKTMWVLGIIALNCVYSGILLANTGDNADFDKLLFVKRYTYSANHYYTEYINSKWLPGGNICLLDMKTKQCTELVPEFKGGVFGRFDLDFDARHIVFAWKQGEHLGYRLYEVKVDPNTGQRIGDVRQLTFPQENEQELVQKYGFSKAWNYSHGTEDMHPCYLPDGGIVFISTRCQYGTLCDSPDVFTTTVLYRIDRDGSNMKQLSYGALSEATPVVMPNGRILYTRWEYVNKGAVSVKCLWAMRPDGSGSSEIFGNDIALPPTLIQARPLPDAPGEYVVLGTPHCPQNAVGTIIKLDTSKNIRTREPMQYVTRHIDIKTEPGFHFMVDGKWKHDSSGKAGRLFRDPYPVTDNLFLVARKKTGLHWHDPAGYSLVWLDDQGSEKPFYTDSEISCFQPYPFKPRKSPPVLPEQVNPQMAQKKLATCIVTNVYHGLEDVQRGTIKHLRILEQIPRPWTARRNWNDCYDQQHATITKDTHLGLKVQHGVVPVEPDGSAHFVVPSNRNIFFQVLDENYMAVQTERTFVNYVPGETRSCIGCHEMPHQAISMAKQRTVKALQRSASVPGPQPGETSGRRPIDYTVDVQPVWDQHCVSCHSGEKPKGGLNLTGTPTKFFSVSYEMLIEARRFVKNRDGQDKTLGRKKDQLLLVGPTIGENHPKTGNVNYMPAKSFGSHNSLLISMLAPGIVQLADPVYAARANKLAAVHADIKLSPEELLKVTNWVDTNAQFYGMYWGRKNLMYKDHPNFRPEPTFERAISMTSTISDSKR